MWWCKAACPAAARARSKRVSVGTEARRFSRRFAGKTIASRRHDRSSGRHPHNWCTRFCTGFFNEAFGGGKGRRAFAAMQRASAPQDPRAKGVSAGTLDGVWQLRRALLREGAGPRPWRPSFYSILARQGTTTARGCSCGVPLSSDGELPAMNMNHTDNLERRMRIIRTSLTLGVNRNGATRPSG